MNPKESRDRLLRNRPNIRNLEILNDGGYSKDIKILWVAQKHSPFLGLPKDIPQDQFVMEIIRVSGKAEFWVVEDNNSEYEGRGLIALIAVRTDGWKIEPHVEFFPWATNKNVLRTCVAFFQMIRNSRKVGVCIIKSLRDSVNLFNHCIKYFPPGVLWKVGRIPNGDERGDEYLYSIKGRK